MESVTTGAKMGFPEYGVTRSAIRDAQSVGKTIKTRVTLVTYGSTVQIVNIAAALIVKK